MFLKHFKTIPVVLSLSAAIAVTGCSNAGGFSSSSDDGVEFFSKSGLTACAAGAALGAGACLLSNASNKTTCAVIAAVATCGVAMGTNYYLDHQRAKYTNKEERLNAYIKDAQRSTNEAKKVNASAKASLARKQQQVQALQTAMKSDKSKQAEAKQALAELDNDIAKYQKALAGMKKQESEWRDVARSEKSQSRMNTTKLNAQINNLNKEIKSLEKVLNTASKQRSALAIS